MKKKIMVFLIAIIIFLSNIVIFNHQTTKSEQTSSSVFFDDFNDNTLDITKWTEDVIGSGDSFEEINGEAKFTTYGHYSWDKGHSILWSKNLSIINWDNIIISGKWKFIDPYTAEMRVLLYDSDNISKYGGVTYATWTNYAHEHIRFYYKPGFYEEVPRTVPTIYVNFQIIITKNEMQYWENNVLINTVNTTTLAGTNNFKLQIGAWDYSAYTQHFYFDDITINTDGEIAEAPLVITISSPEEDFLYTNNMIWFNASANKQVNNWFYSLDNANNISINPNEQISVSTGHHDLTFYGVDSLGNSSSASVSFDVVSNTAIVGVESTMYGVSNTVGDFMSVHVFAESENNFISERLYAVDIATNQIFNLFTGSLSNQSVDKAIVVSVLDLDDSNYNLFYEAVDINGDIVTGFVEISVKNAKFDIVYVDTTLAQRIYVGTKASLGSYTFTDEADHFPVNERGSFVYVTVINNGRQGGAAKLEVILPDYLTGVSDNPVKYIYLNPHQSKCYTFYVLLTKYNPVTGWEPSDPTVFPSNKKIPITVKITHFPSYSLVDTQSAEISFKLGPIFKFESYGSNLIYVWPKDPNNANYPYDGDGDRILEAAEGHHFYLKFTNIGDEPANLQSFQYIEIIPCDSTKYWPNSRNYGYISNVAVYYPTTSFPSQYSSFYTPEFWDERNTKIFGELWPQGTTDATGTSLIKYMGGGLIDWWEDNIALGYYPPANYSGDVHTCIQLSYSIPTDTSKPYGYYSSSIDKLTINVKALEKTFTSSSFTLKDGDIDGELYSVDLKKNTTQIKVKNNNDYVYFEYKLDSYYDTNPEGYKWYHTIPPEYTFNVFAECRDPNTAIPHMKAIFGVKWSVWANELKLGMMTLEAVVNIILQEVTGGAVEVEFADTFMGITNTLLQIMNAYKSISQGVPPSVRINGVTIDLQELADQGLDRAYFTRIANGDVDADMITTLVDALWENEELKEVVGREILKAIANKLGLKEVYDLMTDEDTQEQAFDDLLEEFLDYLVSTEQLTKTQSDAIGDVVDAAKTFMDLGEWAYNNVVSVGSEEISINVLDPPGNFTTDYEVVTTNYFGGPYTDESNIGKGDVTISLSENKQVEIKGDYTIKAENIPFDVDKIKYILISVTGERQNNKMIGEVNIEIIPKPQHALDCFVAFRNPIAQENMISSNFETLDSYSAVTEGDKVIITGTGVLRTSSDDTSIDSNLEINESGLQSSIKRTGYYLVEEEGKSKLDMKFKPTFGVSLDDIKLSVVVEEGTEFDSDLPFEKEGNVYTLNILPEEISADYITSAGKGSDVTLLIVSVLIILILTAVVIFFVFYRKQKR